MSENRRIVPILAGGGTRLPAHVGVIQALEDLNLSYQHIVGVSGGSIVSALRAYGKSVAEIKEMAMEIDFRQFRGFSLYQLMFHGGLSSGDHFERWMDNELDGATFSDLQLDLHVVATDVRTGKPVIFDREHTPDLPVSTAVRFSMGIPLLFSFKKYKHHLLVDGSILAEEALRQEWDREGAPVFCFRLRGNSNGQYRRESRWFPLPDYLVMLVRAFMTTISREFVNDANWNSTVVIDTGEYSPTDFTANSGTKLALFECGYQTTREFLPLKLEAGIASE
ncbi:MAG: patatin-like phospholipase family protein [Gammaproteobacteria bacterium]|nr:patatin-like phospholipase family protein [Gammaproteobacteria bacterium]